MERGVEWDAAHDEVADAVVKWRQAHPKATLREIEEMVDEQLAKLRTRWVQDVAQASAAADVRASAARPSCPQCGGPVQVEGRQKRRLRTPHEQEVELARSYVYCPACQAGFFPPR